MSTKKIKYRVVPTVHEKFGSCWAVKDGDVLLKVFINKQSADKFLLNVEKQIEENFLLQKRINQELKIN
jgi:hypothetical protein